MPGLSSADLLLGDGVALHDVDAVGRDHAQEAVGALQRLAARQQADGGQGGKRIGRDGMGGELKGWRATGERNGSRARLAMIGHFSGATARGR